MQHIVFYRLPLKNGG